MNDAYLGMLWMCASVWALSYILGYLVTDYFKKRFTVATAILCAKVGLILNTFWLVLAGSCDLYHGHTLPATLSICVGMLFAAYWPIVAAIRYRIATAPQRRERAEERRREAQQRVAETAAAAKRKHAVHDLTQWYDEQKTLLAAVPDAANRDAYLVALFLRYDQLVKEKLEELTP